MIKSDQVNTKVRVDLAWPFQNQRCRRGRVDTHLLVLLLSSLTGRNDWVLELQANLLINMGGIYSLIQLISKLIVPKRLVLVKKGICKANKVSLVK